MILKTQIPLQHNVTTQYQYNCTKKNKNIKQEVHYHASIIGDRIYTHTIHVEDEFFIAGNVELLTFATDFRETDRNSK